MDEELTEEYLLPFKRRIWNQAVQEKAMFIFLVDYFTETLYWHPNFSTICTDLVMNSMTTKYVALSNLSKLDFHICFPYVEYHQKKVHRKTIEKIANVIFQGTDQFVESLANECKLAISNHEGAEKMLKKKMKHVDLICSSAEMKTYLPQSYLNAMHIVQNALKEVFAHVHHKKETTSAAEAIEDDSGIFDFLSCGATDFNNTFDHLSTLFQRSPKKKSPAKPRIRKPAVKKPKKTQEELDEEKRQNEMGVARVQEIIKEQEQQYLANLTPELSYPFLNENGLGGQSFDQLLDANFPKPKKRRDYTKEKEGREARLKHRTFSKPDGTASNNICEQPSEDYSQIVPHQVIQINEEPKFLDSGEKIRPGINAPTSVRLTGGGRAIMQPNPKLQQVMRQKEIEDQRLRRATEPKVKNLNVPSELKAKPQFVKTFVETGNGMQMRLVEKITPVKTVEQGQAKLLVQRSSYSTSHQPIFIKKVQGHTNGVSRVRLTSVNGRCFSNNQKELKNESSFKTPHQAAKPNFTQAKIIVHARNSSGTLTKFFKGATSGHKVYELHRMKPQSIRPHGNPGVPVKPNRSKEPTLKQLIKAKIDPVYQLRTCIPQHNVFGINPSQAFDNNNDNSQLKNPAPLNAVSVVSSKADYSNVARTGEVMNIDQQKILPPPKTSPRTRTNQWFNLDFSQIIDHEEIVTTSEDELFNLLEQEEATETLKQSAQPPEASPSISSETPSSESAPLETSTSEVPPSQEPSSKPATIKKLSIIDQALQVAMLTDGFNNEETVHIEEIEDNGELLFEDPKGDDLFFTAEEIESLLSSRKEESRQPADPTQISVAEHRHLETNYPDLFTHAEINPELQRIMGLFILGRLENPFHCSIHQMKICETIIDAEPKQLIEHFFEMNFDTYEWKSVQKPYILYSDGTMEPLEFLNGPQINPEPIHSSQQLFI